MFKMRLLPVLAFTAISALAGDIPTTAVQTAPGVYSYKDAQGKKWIYRTTPFGVVRLEDRPAPPPTAAVKAATANIQAFDAGEFVRFERPGPFGTYKWETKKSELSESERTAWEKSQAKRD
jgi:hypothetical protein